ncbi:MAG: hypothetical protein HY900_34325 [Deltaproteobacteria bacterium]|nr:hypothetical protein [Deltaproteobacteria bacterium]
MALRPLYRALAAFLLLLGFGAAPSWAAVGCELDDPEREVPRLYPGATGYKAVTVDVQRLGGNELLARIEARLREKLQGLYERIDVPYTVFVIYAQDRRIGYIHGVNQKGRFGGIQIVVALTLDEQIKTFYIQRMTGPYAAKFRDPAFGKQFAGLALRDFDQLDVATGRGSGKISEIKNPAPEADFDFNRILRGTKKNLILVNEFLKMSPALSAQNGAPAK